ncbi:uncharacterized protein BCR38DRAFT_115543 [Pseudomassariella vexata]|uniref:FAD dependent oxidoreductase domain-containing protein n=1 Tax=Pseudomassariella vexata TaxID=1141098 RepID=A0A1Y2DD84_9PEZI|nr:uncharacterized protein BCR38DRAFT_115543 [Pseudomassariella vexata]ORY56655.1 hypothetical protein BCR38DRAFT_115543 [Pseudomassariella vexata]
MSKNFSVVMIGGGTRGCSSALHLADALYLLVKMSTRLSSKLCSFSDGDDEAVVRALLAPAGEAWAKEAVFSPYYHDTGYIVAGSPPETSWIESFVKRWNSQTHCRHHDTGDTRSRQY